MVAPTGAKLDLGINKVLWKYGTINQKEAKMQSIEINNPELESFIKLQYGEDRESLLNDFTTFIKTELIAYELKRGFDEVKEYEEGAKELSNASDVIARLRSGD